MLTVYHKEYGEGRAICFCERGGKTLIVIDFHGEKKDFSYPDAFAEELTAADPTIARAIAEELAQKA